MPRRAWTYIWFIFLAGTVITVLAVLDFMATPDLWSQQWHIFGVLTIFATLSQLFKAEAPDHQIYHTTLVFQFAGVILLHPALFALLILIPHLAEWMRERLITVDSPHLRDWYLQPFNIFIHIIIGSLSHVIFIKLSAQLIDLGNISNLIAAVVTASTYVILNHLLVGLALVFARGISLRESGIMKIDNQIADLVTLSMGYSVAIMWGINLWLVLVALAPLVLIYRALSIPILKRQAQMDAKTKLWNAGYFKNALQEELTRAQKLNRPLSLAMADLDLLRNINNTYGHLAGDAVLQGIAQILKESAHTYDIVARFGGEEFSILMPETTSEQAHERIEIVRKAIENAEFTVPSYDKPIKATMSFGVAARQGSRQSTDELVHCADVAVYQAKQNGRNRSYVYNYQRDIYLKIPTTTGETPKTNSTSLPKPIEPTATITPPKPTTQPQQIGNIQPPTAKSRPTWAIKTYIGGMALFALILVGVLVRFNTNTDWTGLFAFTALVILVEVLAIEINSENTTISTSIAPYLAGILLFGPIAVVIIAPLISLINYLKHQSPIKRMIFNISNHAIIGLLSAGIIILSGHQIITWPIPIQIIISVMISLFAFLISTALLAGAISLDQNQRFHQIWIENFRWLAPYYLAFGFVVYTLIFSYTSAGLLGLLGVLVPLLMLRFSQKQYVDHTEKLVKQLRTTNENLKTQSEEITLLNEELLLTLARSIDLRDPYVMEHSKNVSRYALFTAREMGLLPEQQEQIRKAGLLHDVGKLGIPENILFKPSSLTTDEYEIVKEHVNIGADLIFGCHTLHPLIPFVKYHHERFDGTGYPDRLTGQEIPLEARILNLADAVEAMASDRPYKKAISPEIILDEIVKDSGDQFDPEVVAAFQQVIKEQGLSFIINSARNIQTRGSLST